MSIITCSSCLWARVAWQQTTATLVQQPLAYSSSAKVALSQFRVSLWALDFQGLHYWSSKAKALSLALKQAAYKNSTTTKISYTWKKSTNVTIRGGFISVCDFQTFISESLNSDLNDPDIFDTNNVTLFLPQTHAHACGVLTASHYPINILTFHGRCWGVSTGSHQNFIPNYGKRCWKEISLQRDELWTEPRLVEANEINSHQAIDCEGWVFKHLKNTNKQT